MGETEIMFVVGERINTSRTSIKEAVESKNEDFILAEARNQIEAGATMVDVNCGTSMGKELEDMLWLIETIQKEGDTPLCIDSPNIEVLKEALKVHKGKALINSITAEKSRYEKVLPICKGNDCLIVALTLDERGMPKTAQERFEIATIIMEICQNYGISKDRLYFDPLIRPISAEPDQAREVLLAIKLIKEINLKTIAGVSNISFGLPNRRLINRTFLSMAYAYGLDACIVDPLDKSLMSSFLTSRALLGQDQYSMGYISAYREKRLV